MKDDILRRIKRCMALTQSSNENEAAIALKQARKLMQEHGITEQHVLAAEITELPTVTNVRRSVPTWNLKLHRTVAEALDCEHIIRWWEKGSRPCEMVFIGEKLSVEVAEYAYMVLHRQLVKARKEFIKTDLKRMRKQANKTKMADAYCLAWTNAVYAKCKNLSPNKDIKEKIKAYKETKFKKLGDYDNKAKKIDFNNRRVCEAFSKGAKDAENVNLYTATEHSPVTLIG